ncbi:hypothetical protein EXE48_11560 [Halorubrum sp. ASP1]|jgi:hypothetical protein|uniref:hypothetical protein n=1 Tax=Halorubrum sp. ASP1 TaxID=2518114 RepID=UPI0010F4FCF8|nr:hypothetical protein [Halorubrum sp. ASP1]TKX60602.1 hypothetical protein EXE48_11560 [Halorubrum sp. ASP1]
MNAKQDDREEVYQIDCPDCSWKSRKFERLSGELAAKEDAEQHYIEDHNEKIPEDAPFGDNQCPKCLNTKGFNGTVSCSECGFVPPRVRA